MAEYTESSPPDASQIEQDLYTCLQNELGKLSTEIGERNGQIFKTDDYVYGDRLERSLDIPIGHDFTPVNWLRRTVEIHKTQFMGRPFQLVCSYDTKDESQAEDDTEKKQVQLLNAKQKAFAELRVRTINDIIRDNGGHSIFAEGAESASVAGDWIVKTWYDDDNKKFVLSPVEAVENCWALWQANDFRAYDLFAYVYQISPEEASTRYGIDKPTTSPLGAPMVSMTSGNGNSNNTTGSTSLTQNMGTSNGQYSNQPMVTVLEATGKIPGYASKNGTWKKCTPGDENEANVLFIGGVLQKTIDDPKKLPRYYVFPNKVARRRAWGISDISDPAININATYVETLSDWRTVQMKVNFPKFRGFNFGPDTQMPKMQNRKVQILPMGDGQDMQPLSQGDANGLEFKQMMDELQNQFVRETGISRVLFDDPSVTLNSNQALLTSMKPTSDIAENKKQLWQPILVKMFDDAIHTLAAWDSTYADLADDKDPWYLRVMWPSIMQKEDPVYQQMLLNRFNAGTISVQSYLEAQGETKEEIDRIRDEMDDPITSAILGRGLPELAHNTINKSLGIPPWGYVVPKVNLKGDLTPGQEGNMAFNYGFNGGQGQPFPPEAGPQGNAGTDANDNQANQGYLNGQYPNQTPNIHPAPVTNNQPGQGAVSQPGSGAPAVGAQGALNQASQQSGQ